MRQTQSTILYLYLAVIILAGLGLFIFKDYIVDTFLNDNVSGPVVNVTRNNSEFKLDVLRDSRIKALKNYISVFNYDDLNKSQEIILSNVNYGSDIIISNPDNEATSTTAATNTKSIIRVRVGNSNPFLKTADK